MKIGGHCRTPDILITTTGASFGAYHAANTLLKHPDLVRRCLALSGVYDLRRFMDGDYDDSFYFNNPVDYMAGLSDPYYLDHLQRSDIHLATGSGPWEDSRPTYRLSEVLRARGIPGELARQIELARRLPARQVVEVLVEVDPEADPAGQHELEQHERRDEGEDAEDAGGRQDQEPERPLLQDASGCPRASDFECPEALNGSPRERGSRCHRAHLCRNSGLEASELVLAHGERVFPK